MIFKFLLIVGLVCASAQASQDALQSNTDVSLGRARSDDSSRLLDAELKEFVARIRAFIAELENNRPQVPDWVPEPLIELLKIVVLNIEVGPVTVGEILCYIRHFDLLVAQVRVVTSDAADIGRVVAWRVEESIVCNAIGGWLPRPSHLVARIKCNAEVEVIFARQFLQATVKLGLSLIELVRLEREINNCDLFAKQ